MPKHSGELNSSQAEARLCSNAEQFAEDLKQRSRAARGLEHGILTEVPLLYGSPNCSSPNGDAGITLNRLHQDQAARRNGRIPQQGNTSEFKLPYERLISIFIVALGVFFIFLQ